MVWPFEKKRVIDLTKGKLAVSEKSITPAAAEDFQDLGQNSLGFLGNMAENAENLQEKDLKVKIEDMQYKLDNLTRKLNSLVDRIDLAEKKIDRDLRRTS